MPYADSDEATQPRAGRDQDPDRRRLRRGQDDAGRRGQRGPAAAHRGGTERAEPAGGRARRRRAQVDHDGRDGLRPDHHQRRPGRLLVRDAWPEAVLVHVGRAGLRRARRGRDGRHQEARRQLPVRSTTSSARGMPFVVAVNCFDDARRYPLETMRAALNLDPRRAARALRRPPARFKPGRARRARRARRGQDQPAADRTSGSAR